MAILDAKLVLSDAQSLAGLANHSVGSTNAINLGTGYNCWGDTEYNNIGEGGDLWLNVKVATTFTAGTGTTVTLRTASTAANAASDAGTIVATYGGDVGSGGTWRAGDTIVRAKVPAGYKAATGVWTPLSQYIGLHYCNVNSALAAGAVDAWISMDSESEATRT